MSSIAQFGMSLYATYATVASALIIVSLTIVTVVFNIIEIMIDGLWPPRRFGHRHEISDVNISETALRSSTNVDLESGSKYSVDHTSRTPR